MESLSASINFAGCEAVAPPDANTGSGWATTEPLVNQQYYILNEEGRLFDSLFQQQYSSNVSEAPSHSQVSMENDDAWEERQVVFPAGPQYTPVRGTVDPRAIFGPFHTQWKQSVPTAHHSALELYSPSGLQQQVDTRTSLCAISVNAF